MMRPLLLQRTHSLLSMMAVSISIVIALEPSSKTGDDAKTNGMANWKAQIQYRTGRLIDIQKLMREFTLICPRRYTCMNHDSIFTLTISIPNISISCSCDHSCVDDNSCCPESIFGYLNYGYINVVLFPEDRMTSYYMINSCPKKFDKTIRSRCELDQEMLLTEEDRGPVKSFDTHLNYKNRFCAICNGETNYQQWEITVKCLKYIPMATYQSFQEFRNGLAQNNCTISYQRESETYRTILDVELSKQSRQNISIKTCNVTELWETYDPDIDWACQHLKLQYRQFQNVFCYICNPSIASQLSEYVIDRCNVTGDWNDYNQEIEKACNSQPKTQRLTPFKNIYCMICNGINRFESYKKYKINNLIGTIKESIKYGPKPFSKLEIILPFSGNRKTLLNKMNLFFSRTYNDSLLQSYPSRVMTNKQPDGVNDTILQEQIHGYKSVCGVKKLCNERYPKSENIKHVTLDTNTIQAQLQVENQICRSSQCRCEPTCAEAGNCCEDILLQKHPYSCYEGTDFVTIDGRNRARNDEIESIASDAGYMIIDTCLGSDVNWVSTMCTDSISSYNQDILIHIPLNSSLIAYKNVYCLLCNTYMDKAFDIHIQIQCPTLLEVSLVTDIEDLLRKTKKICVTSFQPIYSKECRRHNNVSANQRSYELFRSYNAIDGLSKDAYPFDTQTVINTCNLTKRWTYEQKAIRDVCEGNTESVLSLSEYVINNLIYKNFACFICNPEIDVNAFDKKLTIATCNVTGDWEIDFNMELNRRVAMETLCKEGESYPRWFPFKNVYCRECNLPQLRKPITPQSQEPADSGPTYIFANFDKSSYSIIFRLSPSDVTRMKNQPDDDHIPHCENGTYDQVLKDCRNVYCQPRRLLRNGTCQPLLGAASNKEYEMSFNLIPTLTTNQSKPGRPASLDVHSSSTYISMSDIFEVVTGTIKSRINNNTRYSLFCKIAANTACIDCFLNSTLIDLGNITHLTISYQVRISKTDNIAQVENILVNALSRSYKIKSVADVEIYFKTTYNRESNLRSWETRTNECIYSGYATPVVAFTTDEAGFGSLIEVAFIDRFFACPQIQISADKFSYDNETDTIFVGPNNASFTSELFREDGSSVRICADDFLAKTTVNNTDSHREHGEETSNFKKAYNIFSNTCTLLSLFCLFLTFVTYSLFPVLRTVPGKNNMSLVFSLFIAQTLLRCGLWLSNADLTCAVMGCFIHYFWMATFCAMNICSFHMFKMFYLLELSVPHSQHIFKYLIYTYGVPLLIVLGTACAHLILSNGGFSGYGKTSCFLSDVYSIAVSFIAPASMIFIANIIFFGIAFHKIRTSPRVQSSADRRELFIYVKLCTLVGITWPLQFIDPLFDLSIVSFFVVSLNALQGVFIFISYVCNKRVVILYKKILCSRNSNVSYLSTPLARTTTPLARTTTPQTRTTHSNQISGDFQGKVT